MKFQISVMVVLLSLSFFIGSCKSSRQLQNKTNAISSFQLDSVTVAFYNVENLFDTLDEPGKIDEEYTPGSKLKWDATRYQKKLDQLAKVLSEMGFPNFIGLCEIENKAVLSDLVKHPALAPFHYQIEHFDSPDLRGIDVAFLYQSLYFQDVRSSIIPLVFPHSMEPEGYTSRDVLLVSGEVGGKQTVHFLVNHWPSRRDGPEKSVPRRLLAARTVRKVVDSLLASNTKTGIVVMGDFNDEPLDSSIIKTLGASNIYGKPVAQRLYNLFYELDTLGKGTYNYRGNWNLLDQIIVNGTLLGSNATYQARHPVIFEREWMLYNDPRNGPSPHRTFGNTTYYGGYSDHLPVMISLVHMKRDNHSPR